MSKEKNYVDERSKHFYNELMRLGKNHKEGDILAHIGWNHVVKQLEAEGYKVKINEESE